MTKLGLGLLLVLGLLLGLGLGLALEILAYRRADLGVGLHIDADLLTPNAIPAAARLVELLG